MSVLESRIKALVDDRLIAAFWDAAAHFKTRDIVLVFDESQEVDPVSCLNREAFLTGTHLPDSIRIKLNRPAKDAAVHLKNSDTAFWLLAMFTDGESACVAVNAKLLAPGGNA